MSQNGREEEVARLEQELAGYLRERIKPGLNSGAIPLLARSIAKTIARWEPQGAPEDAEVEDEDSAEVEDASSAEAEDEDSAESEVDPDFEADMRDLQAELGEDWILSFSVHGDNGWLTAEKDDGSQHVEAQTAAVLSDAVELLNEGGGRQSS